MSIILPLFTLGLLLIPIIMVLLALVDLVRGEFKDPIEKLIWVLIIFFVPIIGSILYCIIVRSKKITIA